MKAANLIICMSLAWTHIAEAQTREHASALNGELFAIIAPTYNDPSGTTSYLRLYNANVQPSTYSITVVGSPSARVYGTANVSVPPLASPQYTLAQILSLTKSSALVGGDTSYSLYLQNPDDTAAYQHVTYNTANGFFENASVCRALLNQHEIPTFQRVSVPNVHTSVLAGYPSQVVIHNYWDAPITYRLTVTDSATGTQVGTMTLPMGINSTVTLPFSAIEQQIGWKPTASQFHANVLVTEVGNGYAPAIIGQNIRNQGLGADINMSLVCAINLAVSHGDHHD